MHPGIRILGFLVFTACLSRANAGQLLLGLLLLSGLWFYSPVNFFTPAVRMLLRLRWFFLSILLLYIWMTPDDLPVSGGDGFVSAGVWLALERICSLAMIALAVSYLLASLEQGQLVAAIYWLATPLGYFRIARDRIALRLVMGMQAVARLAELRPSLESKKHCRLSLRMRYRETFHTLADSLTFHYRYALQQAGQEAGRDYSFEVLEPPPLWQWSFPLVLVILFLVSGNIAG